jgi:hypothetical protein
MGRIGAAFVALASFGVTHRDRLLNIQTLRWFKSTKYLDFFRQLHLPMSRMNFSIFDRLSKSNQWFVSSKNSLQKGAKVLINIHLFWCWFYSEDLFAHGTWLTMNLIPLVKPRCKYCVDSKPGHCGNMILRVAHGILSLRRSRSFNPCILPATVKIIRPSELSQQLSILGKRQYFFNHPSRRSLTSSISPSKQSRIIMDYYGTDEASSRHQGQKRWKCFYGNRLVGSIPSCQESTIKSLSKDEVEPDFAGDHREDFSISVRVNLDRIEYMVHNAFHKKISI